MLRNFSSRNNDLGIRDIVVGEKNYFKQVSNIMVVVHCLRDIIDKFNDSFSIGIAGGGLTSNQDNSWDKISPIMLRGFLDLEVP